MSAVGLHLAEAAAVYAIRPDNALLAGLLPPAISADLANQTLLRLTGVREFFPNREALDAFRLTFGAPVAPTPPSERQWGDFQTPPSLARQVCAYLAVNGVSPRVIVEPTYGAGSFILAALDAFPALELVYGVEIQEKYAWQLKLALMARAMRGQRPTVEIELHQDDIFTHRFAERVRQAQDVLIIGNPPWVTNAELGALDARNLPVKRNLKALNGLDAVTGKGNFDLSEYVLLRLLELFAEQRGTLAMLGKNAVIRNIVAALPRRRFKVANIRALAIDADKAFGAAVDASLLAMELGVAVTTFSCQVAALDDPRRVQREFGWAQDKFVSDLTTYGLVTELAGLSPFVWRQGLKHDCARIMELTAPDGLLVNGNGARVEVEASHIFGLLKSSDLREFVVSSARKKVIVTQKSLDEDTMALQRRAPKLWAYLTQNSEPFAQRKSSIYRNKPPFAIFGIGDYAFLPYKVAISGLYKEPRFALVLPDEGRPVMLDDTCYFIGFDDYKDALITAALLNNALVRQFLRSIVFTDAKRPYTKEVLMRIDLAKVAVQVSFDELESFWREHGYQPQPPVAAADFTAYRRQLAAIKRGSASAQLALGVF